MRSFRLEFLTFLFTILFAVVVGLTVGCQKQTPTPKPVIMALTNVGACYSGLCNANCPNRQNGHSCGPNGTLSACPNTGGACRGIVLDKLLETLKRGATVTTTPDGGFKVYPLK